jgi:hypothetical protein
MDLFIRGAMGWIFIYTTLIPLSYQAFKTLLLIPTKGMVLLVCF